MIRGVLAFLAVVVAQFVIAGVVGWLAHRRNASAIHVGAVTNTVLLFCIASTVLGFWEDGLTLYRIFYAVLMVWLGYRAAEMANIAFGVIKANTQ